MKLESMLYVVPYRNRRQHLPYFTSAIKGKIVIVEQFDDKPFNRAKLLNIGALEIESTHYCFHDIDMIPVKVDYSPADVAHLAGRASQFGYKMPYSTYFGGVTIFSDKVFKSVNGYSNEFWGWGSEDDEMYNNVVNNGYKVEFRDCRFRSLHHSPADRSHHNKNILLNLAGRSKDDGLNNCKYELIDRQETSLYTWLKVKL